MTKGLFDDTPLINPERDKAWEAFIKRKDVKRLMQGKEDFKFPLDGSYDLWCLCWAKAWEEGFKAGWESTTEISPDIPLEAKNRKAKPITADEMSAWVKDTWAKCQAEARNECRRRRAGK